MKKLLLGAAMLLGGISLNAQDGPQIGKDDATYTDVDVNGQTMAVYPLWGWYTALGNQNYGIIGANSRGMAISADGSKMLISNRVADNDIHVEVYNALTGEHIKSVQVSKDIWYRGKTTDKDGNEVDDISGFQANDIQVDAAGNVLLWRMTTNIGVSPAECWVVNLEDGSVKNILSTTVEGLEGRFDYCGVYGDVVNGEAVRIGLSFDVRIIPRIETFGYEGGFAYAQPVQGFLGNLGYYTGISGRDKYFDGIATWEVNREGRITGLQPIAGVAPTPGLGKNAVFSFTKSSLKQGRQMHEVYKLGAKGKKEFVLPSKRRIDFLDIENKIIYELKPFNPRSIKGGIKQLHEYKRELEAMPRFKGQKFKMILNVY